MYNLVASNVLSTSILQRQAKESNLVNGQIRRLLLKTDTQTGYEMMSQNGFIVRNRRMYCPDQGQPAFAGLTLQPL